MIGVSHLISAGAAGMQLEGRYIMVREDVPPASRASVERRGGGGDSEGQRKSWTPRGSSGADAGCKVLLTSSPLLGPFALFNAEQLHSCSGEPLLHVHLIIAAHRRSYLCCNCSNMNPGLCAIMAHCQHV